MELNLEAEDHRAFKKSVLEKLDTENPIATPDLAEKVENPGSWSETYIRNLLLPQTLDHLRENEEKVEVAKEKKKGGMPTQFWVKNK